MFQGHRKVALATSKEQAVERVFADFSVDKYILELFLGVDRWGLNAGEKWTEVSFSRGRPDRDVFSPRMKTSHLVLG